MWIAPTAFTAFCNDIGFITRNIGKDSSAVLLFYNSSDGGDGGRGGNIVFVADSNLSTLADFR